MHYTLFISLTHENCFEKIVTYLIKILSNKKLIQNALHPVYKFNPRKLF
nr:MAG TPA: hypothetical protein [Caudoviricetes sp.]